MNQTIQYYDKNAHQYFDDTVSIDMSANCDRFLSHVKSGGSIVDIGVGSGRDMKYFKERGYRVEGIDASINMCRLASEFIGEEVQCISIQDWKPRKSFDGIWANASLLHLTSKEIIKFFKRLPEVLNLDGVAYSSFKTGIATGEDNTGRYYTNVTKDWIYEVVDKCQELYVIDFWESNDQQLRNNFKWLNFLIERKTN